MKTLKCVVIHKGKDFEVAKNTTYEKAASALMSAKGYVEYISQHGYHFTPSLAEYACRLMENSDGSTHRWSVRDISNVIGQLPQNTTMGDMTFLANMAYADLYPKVLQTESRCLDYAKAVASDIDGYEGIAFCRWTADIIGKGTDIKWDELE